MGSDEAKRAFLGKEDSAESQREDSFEMAPRVLFDPESLDEAELSASLRTDSSPLKAIQKPLVPEEQRHEFRMKIKGPNPTEVIEVRVQNSDLLFLNHMSKLLDD